MVTVQEKAQCIWWLAESNSIVHVQRKFQTVHEKAPPGRHAIMRWKKKFLATGNLEKKKERSGRPRRPEDDVEKVCTFFINTPEISMRQASRELGIPSSTINTILHRNKIPLPKKTRDGKIIGFSSQNKIGAANSEQQSKTRKTATTKSNLESKKPASNEIGHTVDVVLPDKSSCNNYEMANFSLNNKHHHKNVYESGQGHMTVDELVTKNSDSRIDLTTLHTTIRKSCGGYIPNNINDYTAHPHNMSQAETSVTNMHPDFQHGKELSMGIPFSTINSILHQN